MDGEEGPESEAVEGVGNQLDRSDGSQDLAFDEVAGDAMRCVPGDVRSSPSKGGDKQPTFLIPSDLQGQAQRPQAEVE